MPYAMQVTISKNKISTDITNCKGPQECRKLIGRLTKSQSQIGIPPIIDNQQAYENDTVKANIFNSFFYKLSNIDNLLTVLPQLYDNSSPIDWAYGGSLR